MRSEDQLQIACAAYLRMRLTEEYRFYHVPNGFFVRGADRSAVAREMAKLKQMGLSNGVMDLVIVGPASLGMTLYAELKTETGSLSKEQREWGGFIESAGWPYAICRSPEALEDFLDQHGVPSRARLRPLKTYTTTAANAAQ